MKAVEEPRHAASAGPTGDTPAACATAIANRHHFGTTDFPDTAD